MSTLALLVQNDNRQDSSVTQHRTQSLYFSLCVIMVFVMACFGLVEVVNSMRFDTTQDEKYIAEQFSSIRSKIKNDSYLKEQQEMHSGKEVHDWVSADERDKFVQFLKALHKLQLEIISKRNQKGVNGEGDGDNSGLNATVLGTDDGNSMGGNVSGSFRSERKSRSTQTQENPKQVLTEVDVSSTYQSSKYQITIEILFILFAVCISIVFMLLIIFCADQCLTKGQKRYENSEDNYSNTGQNQIKGKCQDLNCRKCSSLIFDINYPNPSQSKRINTYRPSRSSYV